MSSSGRHDALDPRDLAHRRLWFFMPRTRAFGAPDSSIRRLVSSCVGRGIHDPVIWGRDFQVPRRLRDAVTIPLPRLILERSATSPIDGFQKLVFRTEDGLAVETVLIPLHKAGPSGLCLSSQVGCPMGCVFCATARMAKRRNLETWEIIDQFIQARELVQASGRRVTGAVFMGMGEPFLNYDRVLAAADLLRCPYGGAVAARAITISTVGLVPEIDRFTGERRRFRLAISLGAATDDEACPIGSDSGPHSDIRGHGRGDRHAEARRDRVMLAYVCIGGVNVDESDALASRVDRRHSRASRLDRRDRPDRPLAPPCSGGIQAVPRRAGSPPQPAGCPALTRVERISRPPVVLWQANDSFSATSEPGRECERLSSSCRNAAKISSVGLR